MKLTRRTFLQSAPIFLQAAKAAAAAPDRQGTILVVLQLGGGNDGINTVVPYADDHYGRARTTLRLTDREVHKLDAGLGFHPALEGLLRLYYDGRLSVLQGVGYPNMHRDHNVGMQSWQTANVTPAPKGSDPTGWLGRVADCSSDSVPVVFAGSIPPPLAVHSRDAVIPVIRDARDWTLTAPSTFYDTGDPICAAAFSSARRTAGILTSTAAAYPDLPLANSLRTVAQLIRADLGIRIFFTEQGGTSPGEFDNHSNQAPNHTVSLRQLSQSVAAFCDDLNHDHLFDRVLLMTFSEFGRTLTENGRHGTGHGAAAPVFLAGGHVRPGLIGAHPSLSDLDTDALKPHTDFRSLYTTVLESWLAIPAERVLGARFPVIPILT